MPSEIKKFKLAYTEVPGKFDLPQGVLFTQDNATNTDQEQKDIIHTIEKDTDRVCYLGLGDDRVSDIKKKRLVITLNEELALAANVSPDYTQGSDSGRIITELLYQYQYFLTRQIEGNEATLLKAMGFIYINDQGQPAGFSFLTDPNGGYPGWILATIQNTTARPEERIVTVLATPHYVTSEAQSTVSMDNLDTIEEELKAAICNDKITDLMKGIFNTDGSVNISYLAELKRRLIPNQNLDDRDRKQAQLDILLSFLGEDQRASMKQAIADDINFFKTDVFELRLHELLRRFNLSEDERKKLKQASEFYADIYMLAEEHLYKPEYSHRFTEIADEIKEEIHTHQNLDAFFAQNHWAKQYQEAKKTLDDQKEASLAERNNPLARSFFERNFKALGYGVLTGITVGLILGLALITSPLPPLSIALLVISAALICFGGISAPEVYFNEKQHVQKLERYKQEGLTIITNHQEALLLLRYDLPQAIQNSPVQELEQEAERPTNVPVSLADSCYSLWEKEPEQTDPNNEQTQSKTPDTPSSSSQK